MSLSPSLVPFSLPDQEERHWSVREFKEGRKDVLVATDLASKGMDFANIQHVINYDMPTDIENYGEARSPPSFVWSLSLLHGGC